MSIDSNDINLLDAIIFSAEKHRSQHRKDGKTPYINHPLQVMQLLLHEGGVRDPDVLCAAVLHDTVEDTDTSSEELERNFGPRVSRIVLELTDNKQLSKEERKRLQVEHSGAASHEAKLIKICDKICNVRDIMHSPPGSWSTRERIAYIEWAKQVVEQVRGTHEILEAYFEEVCAEGLELLHIYERK